MTSPTQSKQYYTIGAITKACRVLDLMATQSSWELAELSRAVGMPKTTVHRILMTFEDAGYVLQDEKGGRYRLSHKLFSLGSQALSYNSVAEVARPVCKTLLDEFDETVNICLASGTDMVIVDKHMTTQMLRSDNIVGVSFPIFYSASGKAYLAFSESRESETFMRRVREETRPRVSDKAFEAFLREIEETAKTGLGYDYEELFPGVRCVATPLFDRTNKSVAALSITAPTTRLNARTMEKMERALLKAGRDISQRMGSSWPLGRIVTP